MLRGEKNPRSFCRRVKQNQTVAAAKRIVGNGFDDFRLQPVRMNQHQQLQIVREVGGGFNFFDIVELSDLLMISHS